MDEDELELKKLQLEFYGYYDTNQELLLVTKLRERLAPRDIIFVLSTVLNICPYCWDSERPCYCWNDE